MSSEIFPSFAAPSTGSVRLLRFTTAGSVDDGKSTLIGRLLYDSQGIYEDQLESVRKSGINRSGGPIDLSLITDGLLAEREQGITIDVAYRYFSTPRRHFIIADTPGHEQYTRNMATGASTADAAVILIDATRGLLPQSLRHTYIAALLGIRYVIAAVNKMDLVDYQSSAFEHLSAAFKQKALEFGIQHVYAIPVSALSGDNIAHSGGRMAWFSGPTLLSCLESIPVENHAMARPFRLPVQCVLRPNSGFRGFAGQVATGSVRRDDVVKAFPSGAETKVKSIVSFHGELDAVHAGEAATLTLADDIDLSRGDLLASPDHPPMISRKFTAHLIWLYSEPLNLQMQYVLKNAHRVVRGWVTRIVHKIDFNSFRNVAVDALGLNELASVELETMLPLCFDPYSEVRATGSFVLIHPITNATVAAGMIQRSTVAQKVAGQDLPNGVSTTERQERFGHSTACVWFSGTPAAAGQLQRLFFDRRCIVQLVTPHEIGDRELPLAVRELQRAGLIIVVAASSEWSEYKESIRSIVAAEHFFECDGADPSELATICDNLLRVIGL